MNKNISWKNVVLAIFLAGVSLSCENKVTERVESGKAVGQEQTQPEISYGDLIIKEQSDYLMIPVNANEKNQGEKNSLDLSRYDKRNYTLLY
ncbi:hypothetical protein WDZ92_28410, partial [Nostoc sp. NIES-2111]